MTKVGRLIEAHQQLCLAHRIQLAVIGVLYKKPNNEDSLYNEEDANITSVPTLRFEKEQNSTDDDEIIDEDY